MTNKLTIARIKKLLAQKPDKEFIDKLGADPRKGAQAQLKSYLRKTAKIKKQRAQFEERFSFEKQFWSEGCAHVAGIDEAGRGPLAGPVVAAAVILPHNFSWVEVNDSKQLSAAKREYLYDKILEESLAVGIGYADNNLIDEINIYQATRSAMRDAVTALKLTPQQLIIDAMQIETVIPQLKLIKADARSVSVAAASIVAKVSRDHLMNYYDTLYPAYDFKDNNGYGTAKHLAALSTYGVTPIHRQTFEPIKSNILA
ncbi:ribonuclease HII [Liquorilactobacillus capillatus]|uniref:Ribonuclease HII n=1 Tax=Liquorilactobacillus capillatus DSM 19910 TaxID=1423731 RepID=A0A0R1M6I7_9LACO|nr:ribonuclease HII [Liquorilactobacillus capillatus]KRL01188.1 ribonuclease HII [Liquorilactobacillus capillatus DSM 19910]